MASVSHTPLSRSAVWLLAARPRTLPVALAPVAVGSAVAANEGGFQPLVALAALMGALALQVASNFANDVGDHVRGADGPERTGPLRTAQAGLLSARQLWSGTCVALLAAAVPGLYLIAVGGWPILLLGLVSMAAAVAYTTGPAYGYRGLGDVAVFAFFGFAGVLGTAYVQTHTLSALGVAASIPVGALATGILAINNLRDIETDAAAGKRTVAVRFGRRGVRAEWAALIGIAYLIPCWLAVFEGRSLWILLPLATAPIAWTLASKVLRDSLGPELNAALARNAQLTALFSLLFALGILA